ncbi:MAG: 1-acyl-sn-glycerol-3-phosphate acyltransferase [Saprospiraceae bacterium]
MYFVYQFLKIIVQLGFYTYYQKRTVVNRKVLRLKGPAIVVSNHPCTLMDPLNVGVWAREQFYFLANAGLFKSKFGNWFFNTFYCIPIERLQDTGGKPVNNAANFARCDAHMVKGGTLYIAPEGDSWMRRHLQKLKTGTVRIAFNSEQQHDYQLDLKIIPVGLTYSAPTAFRSNVFINVGEPLYVRDFREAYETNALEAVKSVTVVLQEQLRTLMVDTADDAEDLFITQLEAILQNNQPLKPEAEFHRTKQLIVAIRAWQAKNPVHFAEFQAQVKAYFQQLQQYKISDEAVAHSPDKSLIIKLLFLILGLPVFCYGFVHHFFPAFVPFLLAWFLVKQAGLYIGYTSTVKFAVGVITVPLFYWLQSELIAHWFSTELSWWYLLTLPLAGLFAWEYWIFAKKTLRFFRFNTLKDKQLLKRNRTQLTQEIELILRAPQSASTV